MTVSSSTTMTSRSDREPDHPAAKAAWPFHIRPDHLRNRDLQTGSTGLESIRKSGKPIPRPPSPGGNGQFPLPLSQTPISSPGPAQLDRTPSHAAEDDGGHKDSDQCRTTESVGVDTPRAIKNTDYGSPS